MAIVNINDLNIYYEVHGDGEPLLILNGIMMSVMSWHVLLPNLSKDRKIILLDLPNQGKSDYYKGRFIQDDIVDIVVEFIEKVVREKVDILGISYGGEIAQIIAIYNSQLINRLIIANTTAYTTQQLKEIGYCWINNSKNCDIDEFFYSTMPLIYSLEFYEKNIEWLNDRRIVLKNILDSKWYEGFIQLVNSAEEFDVRNKLKKIKNQTLIISGDTDILTPTRLQEILYKEIENSNWVILKNCGHASMYEQPTAFVSQINGFLSRKYKDKVI